MLTFERRKINHNSHVKRVYWRGEISFRHYSNRYAEYYNVCNIKYLSLYQNFSIEYEDRFCTILISGLLI